MLVRVLKSVAGLGFAHAPGALVELDDEEALRWIRGGLAEPVREAPVETATAAPLEQAVTRSKRPAARRKEG